MLGNLLWKSVLLSCLLAIVIGAPALQAIGQSSLSGSSDHAPVAPNAKFEVASIKETNPDQKFMIINALLTYPGARVAARGATLGYLLMEAYRLPRAQIVGGPNWIDKTRFDIDAKPPEDVASRYAHLTGSIKTPPPDEIRQMLRNLLTERFQLKLHLQQQ